MELELIEARGERYLEGAAGRELLRSSGDTNDLIVACAESGAHRVLLYAENMPASFFALSSREAGEILQKLRTYGIRCALVASEERVGQGKFRAMVAEENRGPYFHVSPDRQSAEAWLIEH